MTLHELDTWFEEHCIEQEEDTLSYKGIYLNKNPNLKITKLGECYRVHVDIHKLNATDFLEIRINKDNVFIFIVSENFDVYLPLKDFEFHLIVDQEYDGATLTFLTKEQLEVFSVTLTKYPKEIYKQLYEILMIVKDIVKEQVTI